MAWMIRQLTIAYKTCNLSRLGNFYSMFGKFFVVDMLSLVLCLHVFVFMERKYIFILHLNVCECCEVWSFLTSIKVFRRMVFVSKIRSVIGIKFHSMGNGLMPASCG